MFAPRKIKERRVSLVKDWIVRPLSMLAGILNGYGILTLALAILIIYTNQMSGLSDNTGLLFILMYPAGWILEFIVSGISTVLETH